jgi:hypothetical protein
MTAMPKCFDVTRDCLLFSENDPNGLPSSIYLAISQERASSKHVDVFQKEFPLGCQSADQDAFPPADPPAQLWVNGRVVLTRVMRFASLQITVRWHEMLSRTPAI